ncbi:MAG: HAD hydrolase-like protein [Patescibacteria group bacterium]
MIKLIVFDWDDVFTLGSKEGYIKCLHDTLVDLGVRLDPEEEHKRILARWSQPHREELRHLLQEKPELLDQACKIYEDKFFGGTFVDELTYVDGANDLLRNLSKDYALALATGAHPEILKNQVMPKFDVPDVFAQIISAYDIDDVEKHKPHRHMLDTIMQAQGFTPDESLFIGDAKSDVQMARNAGVEPIVVLTGHLDKSEAEALNVQYIIDNVAQLSDVLKLINK